MDDFLNRRMNDSRYRLNVSSAHVPSTAVTAWYECKSVAPSSALSSGAVLLAGGTTTRCDAAAVKRKERAPFSKEKVKELENRDTSDGSDGGACWSDYERVPGTKPGEKGSCRPKKKKAKKDGDSPKKGDAKD